MTENVDSPSGGSEPIARALNQERKAREALLRDMTDHPKTAREELQEQIDELRKRVEELESSTAGLDVPVAHVGGFDFIEEKQPDGSIVRIPVERPTHLEWKEELGRAVAVEGYPPKPKRGKRAKGGEGA